MDSNINTAVNLFKRYNKIKWTFYIVTEEDTNDKDYFDFSPFCERNNMEYGFTVIILNSDNMTNMDYFKEHCKEISWLDGENVTVAYNSEGEKDIRDLYNLKGVTQINYSRNGMKVKQLK